MTDASTPGPAAPAEPEKPKGKNTPQRWWQWFFIYPAFGLALLTAAPSWVTMAKEIYLDLQDRSLAEAEEQARLFAENIDCFNQEFQRFTTDDGLTIDATICDQTAAIILRLQSGDNRHRVVAIDAPALFEVETAMDFSLISPAFAQPVLRSPAGAAEAEVICVDQTDARTITRHVRVGRQCYDEPLDMLTGWIGEAVPVPCRTSCQSR